MQICMSICLDLCLYPYLQASMYICLPHQSVRLSLCPCVCLSICPSVRPSIHQSVHRSIGPSVCLSVCLSAFLPVCLCSYLLFPLLSFNLSLCMSVYLPALRSVYQALSVRSLLACLSICVPLSLSAITSPAWISIMGASFALYSRPAYFCRIIKIHICFNPLEDNGLPRLPHFPDWLLNTKVKAAAEHFCVKRHTDNFRLVSPLIQVGAATFGRKKSCRIGQKMIKICRTNR
jgi:hypothetical protein